MGTRANEPRTLWETLASIRGDYDNHGASLLAPGTCALALHRLGRWALSSRTPVHRLASKMYGVLSPLVRFTTGITMDRRVTIGRDLVLERGGTISIHPDTTIGERVRIMHGVTLGATPDGGVPTIGDDVIIGAGAVVIGRVHVDRGARIAANSLVISDVAAHHLAVGVPARCRRST